MVTFFETFVTRQDFSFLVSQKKKKVLLFLILKLEFGYNKTVFHFVAFSYHCSIYHICSKIMLLYSGKLWCYIIYAAKLWLLHIPISYYNKKRFVGSITPHFYNLEKSFTLIHIFNTMNVRVTYSLYFL